jgi:RecA-family ATPase
MIYIKELRHKKFPPENHLVGSALLRSNSLMVIGGLPKTYKSFVMFSILMQMACGRPLLGACRVDKHSKLQPAFPVSKPCRVLYFEQEVGEMDMQERTLSMLSGFTPEEQELIGDNMGLHSTDHGMRLDDPEGWARMKAMIIDFKPDIVALDPLKEFHYTDENSAQLMSAVLRDIIMLKEELKFALIITHHTSKPSKEKANDDPNALRGSGYLFGAGDTFWMLNQVGRKNGHIKVSTTLRRGKPLADFYLNLHTDTLLMEFEKWANSAEKVKQDFLSELPTGRAQ